MTDPQGATAAATCCATGRVPRSCIFVVLGNRSSCNGQRCLWERSVLCSIWTDAFKYSIRLSGHLRHNVLNMRASIIDTIFTFYKVEACRSFNNHDSSGTASQVTPQGRHQHARHPGFIQPPTTASQSDSAISSRIRACFIISILEIQLAQDA